MATQYRDNWDLRAGFTKDYDLATSAVSQADKQFADAQKIVRDAYALDKTAATQEGEINRMNQENLEKLLVSQEKVGDFQSQQEIQRALESLGSGFADQPVSTEADMQAEQQATQAPNKVMTDDGKVIDDPNAPIDVVKNEPKPVTPRPAARPMTQIERLQAVEPMLSSPRAKYALRQMVQREATNEARMMAATAPDEAFNTLLKNGVIRGAPLTPNDDGTYTRMMPDGKNKIRLDRNEAAAWVGDMINKTGNQYKLIEERRQLAEKLSADKDLSKARTADKIYADQQQTNQNMREKGYEFGLRTQLERTKAGLEAGLVNLRASKGEGSGSGGGGGEGRDQQIGVAAFDKTAQQQPQDKGDDLSTKGTDELIKIKDEQRALLSKTKNVTAIKAIESNIRAIDGLIGGRKDKTDVPLSDHVKTVNELSRIVGSRARPVDDLRSMNSAVMDFQKKYQAMFNQGETPDPAEYKADLAELERIVGMKK